jgi:DNA-binding transcriptional LysR family regulator
MLGAASPSGEDMELRHLRYFVAVAEELNFRRAAERVYVAQGAFSEQIRKLECELGVRLLHRSRHGVSLTYAGAALLPEARDVLNRAEVARLAAQSAHDRATTRLRLGYMPASLPASVPRALQRLGDSMPLLEATVEPGASSALLDAVRDERLDAVVVSLPAPTAGLRVTSLGDQAAIAALPASHPHTRRPEAAFGHLAPERIIVLPREVNRALYDGILAGCRDAGLSPTVVEVPNGQIDVALLAVAAGAGVGVLPESAADRYSVPGVRFVALADKQPTFATAVVTRRDTEHMPTVAFLRTVSALAVPRPLRGADALAGTGSGPVGQVTESTR